MNIELGAPEYLLPTFGYTEDAARPAIYIDENGYNYVIIERGTELERRTTTDIQELLYWIFSDVTFSMAVNYELNHRVEGQDSRRLLFKEQTRLMNSIEKSFGMKTRKEIKSILSRNPYKDS